VFLASLKYDTDPRISGLGVNGLASDNFRAHKIGR